MKERTKEVSQSEPDMGIGFLFFFFLFLHKTYVRK